MRQSSHLKSLLSSIGFRKRSASSLLVSKGLHIQVLIVFVICICPEFLSTTPRAVVRLVCAFKVLYGYFVIRHYIIFLFIRSKILLNLAAFVAVFEGSEAGFTVVPVASEAISKW